MLNTILQLLSGLLGISIAYIAYRQSKSSKKIKQWRAGFEIRRQKRIDKANASALRDSVDDIVRKEKQ